MVSAAGGGAWFSSVGASALDAGFLDPALEAGFLAFVDAGFADARDAGFSALEAGLADSALDTAFEADLDTGLGADLDAGAALDDDLASALDAGLAAAFESGLAFFAGGASAPSTGAAASSSTSFSAAERFFPLALFGLASFWSSAVVSPSCPSVGLVFFARGLAAGFFAGGSAFGCSFMRVERLGSAGAPIVGAATAALRGIASSGIESCKKWAGGTS